MYSEWKEGCQLIEWMQNYNEDNDAKLSYYSTDISSFNQD